MNLISDDDILRESYLSTLYTQNSLTMSLHTPLTPKIVCTNTT